MAEGMNSFFYAESGTLDVLESSPVIHGCFFLSLWSEHE